MPGYQFIYFVTSFREMCSFQEYIPEDNTPGYRCLTEGIVSQCPTYFDNWKLKSDCVNGQSSWVYYRDAVFKNAYCAICNLGDDILKADVTRDELMHDKYFQRYNIVILDLSNHECCNRDNCKQNTRGSSLSSPWGSISTNSSNHCMRVPFSTECSNPDSNSFYSRNMRFSFLCSSTDLDQPARGDAGTPGIDGQPETNILTRAPSFIQLVFTDYGELPSHQFIHIDTNWTANNNSLLVCKNGSVMDTSNTNEYLHLRLSPSLLEVSFIHRVYTTYNITWSCSSSTLYLSALITDPGSAVLTYSRAGGSQLGPIQVFGKTVDYGI